MADNETTALRILLVEDNPAEREIVRELVRLLEKPVVKLDASHTLAEALQSLDESQPDVVLLDLSLPDSQGPETCRQLTSRFPSVPCVVLTGLAEDETALETLKFGAQDFLSKDQLSASALSRSLRYAVGRKQAERELVFARHQLEIQRHHTEIAHLARLNSLGELATGMAHELNQPLTAIVGYSEAAQALLSEFIAENPRIEQLLKHLVKESHRASSIINRLRKLVRRKERSRALTDINESIRSVVEVMRFDPRFGDTTQVEMLLDEQLPETHVDDVQIEQVFINLLRNAYEAVRDCDESERQIRIESRFDPHSIIVTMSDSGAAISDLVFSKLFEPYYTSKEDGLGMGLAISRSIIEDHRGSLSATRDANGSLCMEVTLPISTKTEGQ